ncbi:MAG: carboxypeptidase-like regulatory domain-containing protein [Vicinamibacterales bacterium]
MTVTLSGFVRNAAGSGEFLPNALVEVKTGPDTGRGVRTDASGAFTLSGLTRGAARFEASVTGFINDGANLDMLTDTVFTFQLRPVE